MRLNYNMLKPQNVLKIFGRSEPQTGEERAAVRVAKHKLRWKDTPKGEGESRQVRRRRELRMAKLRRTRDNAAALIKRCGDADTAALDHCKAQATERFDEAMKELGQLAMAS